MVEVIDPPLFVRELVVGEGRVRDDDPSFHLH